MTIFQIQCFLNVAEYLNFTEAANHLFVAQSSLSRNVSNLEEELGMKLFVRTKKYVRLTSSGAILYEEFSKLMKLGEAAVDRKHATQNLEKTVPLSLVSLKPSVPRTFCPMPCIFSGKIIRISASTLSVAIFMNCGNPCSTAVLTLP